MTETPIRFRPNLRKALEVVLWCASKRGSADFHTVLKVLFGAEIQHLNAWGRPIVGDTFHAMQFGPVAVGTYELMKREPLALEALGDPDPPFKVKGYTVTPLRAPDLEAFSQSELDALEAGWVEFGHLPFMSRTEVSHQHPAWQRAWDIGRNRMDWADFLEGENATPEARDDLAEVGLALRL
ncbi:Panacea domain-containing protein [Roseomonas gilardii subsp. gilardii]|uniref:Panacea domain-containing protein n=1 Tax=Roseomonas gilardii TaxID=257708 RepID=UPI001FFAB4CB|nr:Panacea domain-containing protein [Roseomonas gilardii]UPG72896.1 Panacea domain-containing protein [Roseomonas gilardii subsp. gilardii]